MKNFLNNKRGFIMHPGTWIVASFIIGLLVMYLIANGTLPLPDFLRWLRPR